MYKEPRAGWDGMHATREVYVYACNRQAYYDSYVLAEVEPVVDVGGDGHAPYRLLHQEAVVEPKLPLKVQ
jgi:hypothetical protein